jgi:hypothetical protein
MQRRFQNNEKQKTKQTKKIYEKVPIISGTSATIWLKTNFGPTGYHHPQSTPFPRVCTIPSASVIFKCILEALFCDGVQQCL